MSSTDAAGRRRRGAALSRANGGARASAPPAGRRSGAPAVGPEPSAQPPGRGAQPPAGPDGLNPADPGLRALADHVRAAVGPRGAGAVSVHAGELPGIGSALVRVIADVREVAGATATLVRAGLDRGLDGGPAALREHAPPDGFACAAVWPRAHLGKDFTAATIALAREHLAPTGALWCAVRKSKGAEGVERLLRAHFLAVESADKVAGYRLLRAASPRLADATDGPIAAAEADPLAVSYALTDPRLGLPQGAALRTVPGVFARRELDAGTAALLEHVAREGPPAGVPAIQRVLDLCAGVAPLGLWAAHRWPSAEVLAVESNLLAVACARWNAAQLGVAARVEVRAADASEPSATAGPAHDLALVNPPTHADPAQLAALLAGLAKALRPGAPAYIVVNRAGRAEQALRAAGAKVDRSEVPGYAIVRASWSP